MISASAFLTAFLISSKFRETLDKSLIPKEVYEYIEKNELYGVKNEKRIFKISKRYS